MSAPSAPAVRRLIAVFMFVIIAGVLFHWRTKHSLLPLWAHSVALLGLAGLLLGYALLLQDWTSRQRQLIRRLASLDPLSPMARTPARQAALCRGQALQVLHQAAEDHGGIESYIQGLERGLEQHARAPARYAVKLPLHRRWQRARLLAIHQQGYRHGSLIRRAFATQDPG